MAVLLLTCCSKSSANRVAAREEQAIPVKTSKALEETVPVQVSSIGTVEAFSSVTVRSLVDGGLDRVYIREGQDVHRGDLLFTIDPRPFQAALDQARATLAKDQAQAEQARVQNNRYQELWNQGLVAREQVD